MSILRKERERLYQWVRRNLTGPPCGEQMRTPPLGRILSGVLYPSAAPLEDEEEQNAGREDALAAGGGEPAGAGAGADGEDGAEERENRIRRYVPPSSAGFSFLVSRDFAGQLAARAVCYEERRKPSENGPGRRFWERTPLPEESLPITAPGGSRQITEEYALWGGRAGAGVVWRPHGDGWLATVSLRNKQAPQPGNSLSETTESCLFEVELECLVHGGAILEYPLSGKNLQTDEEQELALRFRNKRIYGVGHGAAVDWEEEDGAARLIRMDWVPRFEVPKSTAELPGVDRETLSIAALAREGGEAWQATLRRLVQFVEGYSAWIEQQHGAIPALPQVHRAAAERIIARLRHCRGRMEEGVEALRTDERIGEAFRLAMASMQRQMQGIGGERGPEWRPFQLAFILLTLASVCDLEHPDREVVDLLWFPTGGGKTEAYFALIALHVFHRRLCYTPALGASTSGGGTAVIMRYSLRLLTQQQFERASRLIAAMELIRRRSPQRLGRDRITAGLWVGGSAVPNRCREVLAHVEGAGDSLPGFVIPKRCPACGSPLSAASVEATADDFRLHCLNPECALWEGEEGDGEIPVQIVDEVLYKSPPTLLFATVDKFAALTTSEQPAAFLCDDRHRPPGLIIQDELHLIASELGSVAALYEAGMDTALTLRNARPKYIASTATIRNADVQVRQLYGRTSAVFPSPGFDADDSYFMRAIEPREDDPRTWGRLYMGMLTWTPAMGAREALAPLLGLFLANEHTREARDQQERDAWWTTLVYHSSLWGLQITRGLLDQSVPQWLEDLRREAEAREQRTLTREEWGIPRVDQDSIIELTSRCPDLPEALQRLETPAPPPGQERIENSPVQPISVGLCTNMISVGMDVSRLAAMIVSAQPLTTAEYIQATSRVGRGEVPGMVATHFLRTQARSLSHFEGFRQFHESMYRFVEPSSVAPFTPRCRERALPAALVIAMRYGVEKGGGAWLLDNRAAGRLRKDVPEIERALAVLRERLARACAEEMRAEVLGHLNELVEQWHTKATKDSRRGLVYYANTNQPQVRRLMRRFEQTDSTDIDEWPVGTSMRSVDVEIPIKPVAPITPRRGQR